MNAPPAVQALYAAEFDYVWNSLRRLGTRREDLEDLSQEVFVQVFKSLSTYDPSRPLRPWLFGVCRRVAADFRKRAHHRREEIADPPEGADPGPSPSDSAERAQQRALVTAALERLEDDRRTVFVLHEIDEVPMPEVAESLGVPLNTCYSRLRLARADFALAVKALQGGAA